MTTKQNAIVLARTARSEAANTAKRTIASIITNWNECVKQAGFTGVFDFATTGYTRKAQLIADLERCAAQLDDYCEPNPFAPRTVEQQTRELNAALTRVLDADEAHAEAFEINLRMGPVKNTVLVKVVSGLNQRAEFYGRFQWGRTVAFKSIPGATRCMFSSLSAGDIKHGLYSIAKLN
ncbi:hypothetical protein [Serratia fonticola]|uniref:hypothetical protein n=1 Tax=Serratia fonticola TaxID=47917 RepID=UPI0034C65DAB